MILKLLIYGIIISYLIYKGFKHEVEWEFEIEMILNSKINNVDDVYECILYHNTREYLIKTLHPERYFLHINKGSETTE